MRAWGAVIGGAVALAGGLACSPFTTADPGTTNLDAGVADGSIPTPAPHVDAGGRDDAGTLQGDDDDLPLPTCGGGGDGASSFTDSFEDSSKGPPWVTHVTALTLQRGGTTWANGPPAPDGNKVLYVAIPSGAPQADARGVLEVLSALSDTTQATLAYDLAVRDVDGYVELGCHLYLTNSGDSERLGVGLLSPYANSDGVYGYVYDTAGSKAAVSATPAAVVQAGAPFQRLVEVMTIANGEASFSLSVGPSVVIPPQTFAIPVGFNTIGVTCGIGDIVSNTGPKAELAIDAVSLVTCP